jgi:hypothetical protein
MDELDLQIYHGYRDALRKVISRLSQLDKEPHNTLYRRLPVILVDYHAWEVHYFEDEYKAQDFAQEKYSSWDDEPPNGDDEELIVFKFYSEKDLDDFPHSTRKAKLWRKINGKKFYRLKTFVHFEPELIINVSI